MGRLSIYWRAPVVAAALALAAPVVAAALALAAPAPASASPSRSCGQVTTSLGDPDFEGQAHHILATRVSCARARRVARACLRDRLAGWSILAGPERRLWGEQTILRRGDAQVSFYIAGGGGCQG